MIVNFRTILFFTLLLLINTSSNKISASLKSQIKTAQNTTSTAISTSTAPSNSSSAAAPTSKYSPEDRAYFLINYANCKAPQCALPYSTCVDSNKCGCMPGYANFNSNNTYCTYTQKKQIVGFCLEFFLSMGIGHFYAQRTLAGILKLLVCLLYCIFQCIYTSEAKGQAFADLGTLGKLSMISTFMLCCGFMIWQLVDIIMFATNSYKDGQGVPLMGW